LASVQLYKWSSSDGTWHDGWEPNTCSSIHTYGPRIWGQKDSFFLFLSFFWKYWSQPKSNENGILMNHHQHVILPTYDASAITTLSKVKLTRSRQWTKERESIHKFSEQLHDRADHFLFCWVLVIEWKCQVLTMQVI
jgi:hypothetical protein